MGVFLSIAGIALGGVASLAACGTDSVGVDACRRVEEARRKRAPSCNVSLTVPPHEGAPGSDVDACVLYYRDACLHGLSRTVDPSNAEVDACIARIENGTCEATVTPALTNECAWLGTELGDASTDGSVEAEASVVETGSTDVSLDASHE